jgi:hypothetical protein
MMFFTGWSRLSSKRRSRLVTMPTHALALEDRQAGDAVAPRELITSRTSSRA